ncbi:MAG: hypothetical protein KatS3mg060_3718 [Dehalococcoidia bacterium]|nr:MAG: hypothetical protein KatS3mg060_3718 [Dehalococcoidia bacterium]
MPHSSSARATGSPTLRPRPSPPNRVRPTTRFSFGGGVGLGKTHLLHAIGHAAEALGLVVIYVTSETFTNEFIRAIRDRQNDAFREKYRSVDVLLIDDIQFLATKEQTQEEFFHTFNDLHSNGKQIVITSDRSPKVMPSLEDRLRSRFEWGLITDIGAPDFETRLAILEKKARDSQLSVPVEVLELIAHRFQNNIRELEGSLNKALMYARSHGVPLTLEVAHQALLGGSQPVTRRRMITPRLVIDTVADYYHVDPSELRGKRRDQHITLPRHVAMYIIREETTCTYQEIGAELGKRDHTTVIHGCEKIATDLKSNQQLAREINEIRTLLYQRGERSAEVAPVTGERAPRSRPGSRAHRARGLHRQSARHVRQRRAASR